MQAVIIAAGLGSRLRPYTEERPKCLLEVGGKTILQRTLDNFKRLGVDRVAIVRGHLADKIAIPGVSYFENTNYKNNNILHSLLYAEPAMDDGFVFTYSDIVYDESVLEKLLHSTEDISVVVDRDWRSTYVGRDKHPITEAELVKVEDGRIVKIGKDVVATDEASGEFIGLGKFSRTGAKVLREEFHRLQTLYTGRPDQLFQHAKSFEKAYLTDMFQEMIDRGHTVVPVEISKGWHEIDTEQDLKRAARYLNH